MGKIKKPRKIEKPSLDKKARRKEQPETTERQRIVWSISIIDRHGNWGWNDVKNAILWDTIMKKMKNFETMTWAEIKQRKHSHSIPVSDLCSQAQRRLRKIHLDDIDDVFQLGLSGKERIFGIRDERTLKVVWWDPSHTVCPAEKKHT